MKKSTSIRILDIGQPQRGRFYKLQRYCEEMNKHQTPNSRKHCKYKTPLPENHAAISETKLEAPIQPYN